MSEFDEVYNSYEDITDDDTIENKQYSKEEYAEFKRNEKSQIYELIDKTAEKIVTSGEEFKKYLDSQSKFDNYSVGNALLVSSQMPKATQLRDLESWRGVGAFKKRFAKAVKILEPGDNYMREDGSVGVNYNVKKVYDISQVTPRQRANNMRYDNKILLKIFLNASSSEVKVVDEIPGTNKGVMYDYEEDKLYIARGAEAPKVFYEVAEELAKQEIGEGSNLDSFKNYCVAYMLCKKYNIDVSNFNFNNIPQELKSMNAREIREELEPIKEAMENINTRMSAFIQRLGRLNQNKENVR